jgi:RHS repeat-associated protein
MNDYFSHATTYTYTDTGLVSTITAPGSKVWTYAYNALGQATSVSIPNGMTTEYGYDTRNRLTAIEHKDGATVLDGFTYALDTGGNITRTTHSDSSLWDYEYDGRDRLTKAERYDTDGTTLLHRYSYAYDDGDNLLTKLVYDGTNTVTTAFAYTDANEQTSMAVGGTTTTMAYDAWGRMTSKTDGTYTAAYAYRYGDKLYSVTSDFPSEGTVTYEYGGDQKRRERDVSGGDYAWYNWDIGWNVINEENSNGTLSMTYTVDSPAVQVAGILADASTTNPATGTYRYYNHDNLGSTRRLRASDKSSLGTYEYTPYGQAYATSGVALGNLAGAFTGKAWDATSQLYYFPFRYYSPAAARWLTRDPLGMVDGPNVYAYVMGNPVNYLDPTGEAIVMTALLLAWKFARAVIGGYLMIECVRCLARAIDTIWFAMDSLGNDFYGWVCRAKPGKECLGICGVGGGLVGSLFLKDLLKWAKL